MTGHDRLADCLRRASPQSPDHSRRSAWKRPDVPLLDEPANKLDLVGVPLEGAPQSYEGAFIVVSHDERFLTEIAVNRRLRLSEGRLLETSAPGA